MRGICTLLCVLFVGWIFSNSLQTATVSAEKSTGVVEVVQEVARVIAPNSSVATATGAALDRLHNVIRTIAHFLEFALLGALLLWCWRAYTVKKIWWILFVGLIFVIPVIDEWLQSFSAGRATEGIDILVDICGGICGGAFALCTVWLATKIVKKRRKRRKENGEGELGNSADKV